MKPVSLETVARVLGAEVAGTVDGGLLVRGGVTDSRETRPGAGQLFFALSGRADGAEFAGEAYRNGAVAVVALRPLDVPTLVVEDPLRALQDLARWTLMREDPGDAEPPRVVGITGSVGKTTTKDALAAILRSAGLRVSATAGNYNNEIGLPLTLLAAGEDTEALVLEMGATHPGDIRHLCSIAPPRIGVLTAVSPVHLESFGSLEDLAAAKGELADSLPQDGTLVAPHDAPSGATGLGRSLAHRIVFGGEAAGAESVVASEIQSSEDGISFTVNHCGREVLVRSPVFGTHLVDPLLAAFCGALALGVDIEDCARGLARLRRTGLRGEVYRLRDGIVVYDDSYNASPAANEAVLRYGAAEARASGGRLVAVLGGMFELGVGAREYHREIGALATELGVELLVCVGDEARWYAEGFAGEAVFYGDAAAAGDGLKEYLEAGDYVVVKGSRGVGLETVSRRLREEFFLV